MARSTALPTAVGTVAMGIAALAIVAAGAAAGAEDSGVEQPIDAGTLSLEAGTSSGEPEAGSIPDDAGAAGDAEVAAATSGGSTEGQAPMPIHIGLYLLHVDDLDLKAGTAEVTYYVWTRWRGSADGSAFELVNGTVESKEHEYRAEENGEKYVYWRCRGTVQVGVDFHDFPFEAHELRLAFEHAELDSAGVVWRVDRDGIRHLTGPVLSGWITETPVYEVTRTTYRTNWGYPGADPNQSTEYSRFNVRLRLRHAPVPTFIKTFMPLFISILIAMLGFFIEPGEIEARVGLGVAGTFGVVTNQAVVAGNLPEVAYMTLSDEVHLAGLICVFLALLASCYTGWLTKVDRQDEALKIDHRLGAFLGTMSVLAVATLILWR